MKYQERDIVRTAPEYGGRVFAIVRIENGKYYAVSVKGKKRYWLEESQIQGKEGVLPAESPLTDDDQGDGTAYAAQQAGETKDARWAFLAGLKPGDKLEVVHRKAVLKAEFVRVNLGKPVRAVRVRINGTAYDVSLDAVCLPEES